MLLLWDRLWIGIFLTSTDLPSGTMARPFPLTTKEVFDIRGLEKTRVMKKRTMAAATAAAEDDEIFIFSPWSMMIRVAM